jgi:hypothetical protein
MFNLECQSVLRVTSGRFLLGAVREHTGSSGRSDSTLQDYFHHVDWDMFHIASNNNIDEYADSVSSSLERALKMSFP